MNSWTSLVLNRNSNSLTKRNDMDAIILAGGTPQPDDPLYPYTKGLPKAMVDICGKPMVQWVLDAVEKAETIESVVLVGLSPQSNLSSTKIRAYEDNQGSILLNIRAGAKKTKEIDSQARHLAIVSADIPAVLPEQIDWVVNNAMQSDEDVYYNVIERRVMEQRFPGSKRSYTRLKDLEVCGGDLNIVRAEAVTGDDALWDQIIAARKNVFKQAALIGYDTLFLLLFRQITLAGAVSMVTKRIHLTGRALVCPYAEIGMDVDKPFQLEIMRAELSKRAQPG
jgi:GTP:adenosylcobinamide-phosphate guanylyltransferase